MIDMTKHRHETCPKCGSKEFYLSPRKCKPCKRAEVAAYKARKKKEQGGYGKMTPAKHRSFERLMHSYPLVELAKMLDVEPSVLSRYRSGEIGVRMR